jgi:N-acetylglucosaminyldiphosphoundecaprenol N-acetyl-beta-D-mannosaminyltransferase
MSRILLMGCPLDSLSMAETIDRIEGYIKERSKTCQHVVVNVSKLVAMRRDYQLSKIVHACEIINVDGMPIVWASKLLGQPLPERVAGIDLFQNLVALCAEKNYRPFFFGAREQVVSKLVDVFKRKYGRLNVAGYRNGYYSEDEEPDIAEMIRESEADVLFVGFSSPMKEIFLNKWIPVMNVPFCMGVGGSFDIVAGRTRRAPLWMQQSGLEWCYRIYQEPRRMWKRYAKKNPIFIYMVLKEYVHLKMLSRDVDKMIESRRKEH